MLEKSLANYFRNMIMQDYARFTRVILKVGSVLIKAENLEVFLFFRFHLGLEASFYLVQTKKAEQDLFSFYGRGGRIRTCDLLLPKQAR